MSEPCALWCLLMKKFAIGKLSAVEVQQLAAAAVKSGATSAEMRELQSLGSMGTCPASGICSENIFGTWQLLRHGRLPAP